MQDRKKELDFPHVKIGLHDQDLVERNVPRRETYI